MKLPKYDENWSPAKKALYWDHLGDWGKAHGIADGPSSKAAAHVHAYLHRKEGDDWNARYWYNRAKQSFPDMSLDQEWETLWKLYA